MTGSPRGLPRPHRGHRWRQPHNRIQRPGRAQPGIVLTGVKAKPSGRPTAGPDTGRGRRLRPNQPRRRKNGHTTTSTGQKVTVDEASTTTYQKGTSSTSPSAITTGETVLVLGTTNGTTITATQVTVEPTGDYGSAASSAAGVVPFQRGAPNASRQVGQIPANYSEGSGTIVSGTTANKATEAALAAYPGGVVDRVVKLSNGEYEVHYIGATGRTTSSSTRTSRSSARGRLRRRHVSDADGLPGAGPRRGCLWSDVGA
jgi:hypothetical protein